MRTRALSLAFLFCLAVQIITGNLAGAVVNLNATLGGATTSQENSDSFFQRYRLNTSANAYPTDLIDISGSLSYSRTMSQNASSVTKTSDTVSPSLAMKLVNEYFSSNLRGQFSQSRSSSGSPSNSTLLSADMANVWTRKFFPNLRGGVEYQTVSSGTYGNNSLDTDLGVDWNLKYVRASYTFSQTEHWQEGGSGRRDLSVSHGGSLSFSQSFWDRRISVSALQNFRTDNFEDTVPNNAGEIYISDRLAVVAAGDDPDGTKLMSELGFLPVGLPVFPPQSFTAVAVQGDFRQENLIFIHVDFGDNDFVDPTLLPGNLSWDVYTSANGSLSWDFKQNVDHTEWLTSTSQLSPTDLLERYRQNGITYVAEQRFFVVYQDGLADLDLKLVARVGGDLTSPAGGQIVINKVEVERLTQPGIDGLVQKQDYTKMSTSINLGFRITDDLRLSSSYVIDDSESVDSKTIEATRSTLSGNLSWTVNKNLRTSLSVSQGENERTDTQTTSYRQASVSVFSTPLPTLTLNTVGSMSEKYLENDLASEGQQVNCRLTAALFHDLDLNMGASYGASKNYLPKPSEGSGISGNLGLRAQLTTRLDASLAESFSFPDEGVEVDSQLSLNWRPSDRSSVSFNSTLRHDNAVTSGLSFSTALTEKIRSTVNYNFSKDSATDAVQNMGVSFTWALNNGFSLTSNGNYNDFTGNNPSWGLGFTLSARFNSAML